MTVERAELIRLRDALIRARLNGVRELQDQSGERLVYKSEAEMRSAIEAVNREIQAHDRRQPHTIVFSTSKGL